jgi:GNAT superfamily N-acetyltransferase
MREVVTVIERPGLGADMPYVFHSWLKGARGYYPEMRHEDYYALQHQRIERLVTGPGRLVVLHPEGAPAVIAAWALLDNDGNDIAHYVHVRGEYRGKGFAARLLSGRTIATHMTEQGARLKRKLGLRYMPHLLDGLA